MAEEEMKHKKDLRRAQRAVITKTIKVVDDLVKGSPLEEARLRQKKSVLIDKCNTVKALDQEILLAAPADELEAEIERADEVQEYIELAIALIDETLAAATTSTALEDTCWPCHIHRLLQVQLLCPRRDRHHLLGPHCVMLPLLCPQEGLLVQKGRLLFH